MHRQRHECMHGRRLAILPSRHVARGTVPCLDWHRARLFVAMPALLQWAAPATGPTSSSRSACSATPASPRCGGALQLCSPALQSMAARVRLGLFSHNWPTSTGVEQLRVQGGSSRRILCGVFPFFHAGPGGEHDQQVARVHDAGRTHLNGRAVRCESSCCCSVQLKL